MHRVLVLNDTIGSKNFGCQLVSNSVRKVIGKYYPESKVDYIGFQTKNPTPPAEDPDVVIINGEGSYGHHTQNPAGFSKLHKITSYYFDRGIPVHLVNVSIQIPLQFLKEVEAFLSKFTTIGLREPISYLFLLKNTKLKNIRLYPDLGTAYFKEESTVKDIDFCVGFGSISKQHNSIKAQTDKYFRVISNLKSEGYSIKYLGFPGNPFSDGSLASRYLTDIEIEEDTFESYYHSVKRAKINLTGRHHGAVMSFVGKTPFMSFNSNMWKTEGDQLMYGPFDYFRFEDLNEEQLTLYCKDTLTRYSPQRALLDERYNDLQPLFEGHIVCTLGEFTDVVDRGLVNIDEVERTVSTLDYLNIERYGLLGKI
jgi:hypothetical protein